MDSELCIEDGCNRIRYIKSTGECETHWSQRRRGYKGIEPDTTLHPRCSVSECKLSATSRKNGSLCRVHYQRKHRGQNPEEYDTSHLEDVLCWAEDCYKPVAAMKLCKNHYDQAKRGNLVVPEELGITQNPPCTFEGCTRLIDSMGLCRGHNSQRRKGVELTPIVDRVVYAYGEFTCKVGPCNTKAVSRGFCRKHRQALRYGMTDQEVIELFDNPACSNPGCLGTEDLHVDHCHKGGQVRGLLCNACNLALGFLREDPKRITGLVSYLEKTASITP